MRRCSIGLTAKTQRCGTHVPKICPRECRFYFCCSCHGALYKNCIFPSLAFAIDKWQKTVKQSFFSEPSNFPHQNRGMLSNSVQPPTLEHVYAQWQERKESSSAATRALLQENDGHIRDVKEEESGPLMCGDPMSQNHFRSSRAVRLKGDGARTEKLVSCWCANRLLTRCSRFMCRQQREAVKDGRRHWMVQGRRETVFFVPKIRRPQTQRKSWV